MTTQRQGPPAGPPRRAAARGGDVVDAVLDALVLAKRAHALLPPLPAGLRPAHVRVLAAMERLAPGGRARVSDINRALGAALPNTSKFVNELADMKLVRKVAAAGDRRVVLVETTAAGAKCAERYVRRLHARLAEAFAEIGASECAALRRTVGKVHEAMRRVCSEQEPGRGGTS